MGIDLLVSFVKSSSKIQNGVSQPFPEVVQEYIDGEVIVKRLQLQRERIVGESGILHGFVLIEVNKIVMPNGRTCKPFRWIKAERTYEKGKGMIVVTVWNELEDPASVRTLHEVAMSPNTTIPMRDLKEILYTPKPNYDLFVKNCWEYANRVYRLLLERIAERNPEHGEILERALRTVPDYTAIFCLDQLRSVISRCGLYCEAFVLAIIDAVASRVGLPKPDPIMSLVLCIISLLGSMLASMWIMVHYRFGRIIFMHWLIICNRVIFGVFFAYPLLKNMRDAMRGGWEHPKWWKGVMKGWQPIKAKVEAVVGSSPPTPVWGWGGMILVELVWALARRILIELSPPNRIPVWARLLLLEFVWGCVRLTLVDLGPPIQLSPPGRQFKLLKILVGWDRTSHIILGSSGDYGELREREWERESGDRGREERGPWGGTGRDEKQGPWIERSGDRGWREAGTVGRRDEDHGWGWGAWGAWMGWGAWRAWMGWGAWGAWMGWGAWGAWMGVGSVGSAKVYKPFSAFSGDINFIDLLFCFIIFIAHYHTEYKNNLL